MGKQFESLTANNTLDETLKALRNKSTGLSVPELAGYLYPDLLTMEPSRVLATEILELLYLDGYAKRDNQSIYSITFKGRAFIANGGYRYKRSKEIILVICRVCEILAIGGGAVIAGWYYWNHLSPCQ